jgi:hypothetical protein
MGQSGVAKGRVRPASTVADLARFFPEATPVRIPVELTRGRQAREASNSDGGAGLLASAFSEKAAGSAGQEKIAAENTVIEFGTSREVLFACTTPLEFADILRLRNSDGSLDTEASVVAVQYHPGATVVAARFLNAVPNWIVKS